MAGKQRAAVIARALEPHDPEGGHRTAADYGQCVSGAPITADTHSGAPPPQTMLVPWTGGGPWGGSVGRRAVAGARPEDCVGPPDAAPVHTGGRLGQGRASKRRGTHPARGGGGSAEAQRHRSLRET